MCPEKPARFRRPVRPYLCETIRSRVTYITETGLGRGRAAGMLRQHMEPRWKLRAPEERAAHLDDQHRAQPLPRLAAPAADGSDGRRIRRRRGSVAGRLARADGATDGRRGRADAGALSTGAGRQAAPEHHAGLLSRHDPYGAGEPHETAAGHGEDLGAAWPGAPERVPFKRMKVSDEGMRTE